MDLQNKLRSSRRSHARVILDGATCRLSELGDVRDVLGVLGVDHVVPIVLRVLVATRTASVRRWAACGLFAPSCIRMVPPEVQEVDVQEEAFEVEQARQHKVKGPYVVSMSMRTSVRYLHLVGGCWRLVWVTSSTRTWGPSPTPRSTTACASGAGRVVSRAPRLRRKKRR